jgi:hypothetical protein
LGARAVAKRFHCLRPLSKYSTETPDALRKASGNLKFGFGLVCGEAHSLRRRPDSKNFGSKILLPEVLGDIQKHLGSSREVFDPHFLGISSRRSLRLGFQHDFLNRFGNSDSELCGTPQGCVCGRIEPVVV